MYIVTGLPPLVMTYPWIYDFIVMWSSTVETSLHLGHGAMSLGIWCHISRQHGGLVWVICAIFNLKI